MKLRTKRILISIAAAAVLEILWCGLMFIALQGPNNDGQDFLTQCSMPFFMIGALFSGSAEDPNGFAMFFSMFVFLFFASYVAQIIWKRIRESSHEA
jgi:hypothetical protein